MHVTNSLLFRTEAFADAGIPAMTERGMLPRRPSTPVRAANRVKLGGRTLAPTGAAGFVELVHRAVIKQIR